MSFKVKYKNAKKAIKQIRSGEWEPVYNPISRCHIDAKRGSMSL